MLQMEVRVEDSFLSGLVKWAIIANSGSKEPSDANSSSVGLGQAPPGP